MQVSDDHHTLASLAQEWTPVSTELEDGWTSETLWIFWRREKSLTPMGIRTQDHQAHSLVAIVTMAAWHLNNTKLAVYKNVKAASNLPLQTDL
jgi:hypothetical protein